MKVCSRKRHHDLSTGEEAILTCALCKVHRAIMYCIFILFMLQNYLNVERGFHLPTLPMELKYMRSATAFINALKEEEVKLAVDPLLGWTSIYDMYSNFLKFLTSSPTGPPHVRIRKRYTQHYNSHTHPPLLHLIFHDITHPETMRRVSNAVAVGNDGWDYCYFNWTGWMSFQFLSPPSQEEADDKVVADEPVVVLSIQFE